MGEKEGREKGNKEGEVCCTVHILTMKLPT